MNGATLKNAAKIIVKAGMQIDSLLDLTMSKLEDAVSEIDNVGRVCVGEVYSGDDDNGWITTNCINNLAVYEKRSKKPNSHIAVEVVVYDEEEASNQGWEPSIYVMFSDDREPFDASTWRILDMVENELRISSLDRRLWCSYQEDEGKDDFSCWMFVLPLVKINNEDDIVKHIVEPAKKIISGGFSASPFSEGSPAFSYSLDGEKISILSASV